MSTRRTCEHAFSEGHRILCPYGNCTIEVCNLDGMMMYSVGPVLCQCDSLPGFKSSRVDQMSKPHPPMKAKGRHGGRIIRSERRHVPPQWQKDWALMEEEFSNSPEPSEIIERT